MHTPLVDPGDNRAEARGHCARPACPPASQGSGEVLACMDRLLDEALRQAFAFRHTATCLRLLRTYHVLVETAGELPGPCSRIQALLADASRPRNHGFRTSHRHCIGSREVMRGSRERGQDVLQPREA